MDNFKKPLVTICIPFYNCEKYLDFAIRSTLNQTYKNWELILLNDGSTDNSLYIAKKYLTDIRVKLHSDGINRGLVYRLNESIDLANGQFYARMDADDIMHPKRIEIEVEYLIKYNVDIIGSSIYIIDNNNNIIGKRECNYNKLTKDLILNGKRFAHPTIMGKTRWFKENKIM